MAESTTPSLQDLFESAKRSFLDFGDPDDLDIDQMALAKAAYKAVWSLNRTEALALLSFRLDDYPSSFLATMMSQIVPKSEIEVLQCMVAARVLSMLARDEELGRVVNERRCNIFEDDGCIYPISVGGQ